MINFLNPKLLPKIIKIPSSTENYEAENLISDNFCHKTRGFIAYPSTKPPIELEFELLCPVNIAYIFLKTSVGNQRCSGIEIYAKSQTNNVYVSIGRAIYEEQAIIFCNNRKYSQAHPPDCYASDVALNFFKGASYKSFLNASYIKIVIFRTEKSVPCLASVEIWGQPARSCSQKTCDTINYLLKKTEITSDAAKSETCASATDDLFKIPEEFKDDLTYELMTIPYTLPSGKTIDQTTLEKHVESEKSFGRKPGDPFTGLKFTDNLKPVLNVGLKSRIDMFLLQNSHRTETFNLKRSLRNGATISTIKKFKNGNEMTFNTQLGPNFMSFTQNENHSETINCSVCKNNTQDYLYELPCRHLYCRKCLLEICKNCVCLECKEPFVKCDVKKIDL